MYRQSGVHAHTTARHSRSVVSLLHFVTVRDIKKKPIGLFEPFSSTFKRAALRLAIAEVRLGRDMSIIARRRKYNLRCKALVSCMEGLFRLLLQDLSMPRLDPRMKSFNDVRRRENILRIVGTHCKVLGTSGLRAPCMVSVDSSTASTMSGVISSAHNSIT